MLLNSLNTRHLVALIYGRTSSEIKNLDGQHISRLAISLESSGIYLGNIHACTHTKFLQSTCIHINNILS